MIILLTGPTRLLQGGSIIFLHMLAIKGSSIIKIMMMKNSFFKMSFCCGYQRMAKVEGTVFRDMAYTVYKYIQTYMYTHIHTAHTYVNIVRPIMAHRINTSLTILRLLSLYYYICMFKVDDLLS